MKFFRILIVSCLFFSLFLFTGCANKNQENLNKIVVEEKKEKVYIYKRPDISDKLLTSVSNIIKTLSFHDIKLLNKKYIHPSFGVYNLSKIEGLPSFTFQNQIYDIKNGKTEEFSQLIYRVKKSISKKIVNYEDTKFDCSPYNDKFYGWNKQGVYLSDKPSKYLSKLMIHRNKYETDRYKKEDFHKARIIEETSYKIVLTPEVIFYISEIDDNWYITLIDRITTDCSSPKVNKK